MLHKARHVNDAQYIVNKAKKDTEKEVSNTERKRKIEAAAPAYVKKRVRRGERLAYAEARQLGGDGEDEMRTAVLRWIVGEMANELYYDVMDFIMPRWDQARRVIHE